MFQIDHCNVPPALGWLSNDSCAAPTSGSSPLRCAGSFQRSDLNAARISLLKSSGSSHAAKWPPLSTSLK